MFLPALRIFCTFICSHALVVIKVSLPLVRCLETKLSCVAWDVAAGSTAGSLMLPSQAHYPLQVESTYNQPSIFFAVAAVYCP